MLCLNSSGYIVLKLICEKVLLWNIVMCWGMCVLPASLSPFWVSVQYPLSEALCFHLDVISQAAKLTVTLHLF